MTLSSHRPSLQFALVTILSLALLTLVPPTRPAAVGIMVPAGGGDVFLRGKVAVLGQPLAHSKVTLYRAKVDRRGRKELSNATTDVKGRFRMALPGGIRRTDVLYLTSSSGERRARSGRKRVPNALVLASVLGELRPGRVTLNERTTVAAGFGAAQFLAKDRLSGESPGLPNAAAMSANLINPKSGRVSRLLRRRPNGNKTTTKATLNTMANAISACAKSAKNCRKLLANGAAKSAAKPDSSWSAMSATAKYPSFRAKRIFRLSKKAPTFTPVLSSSPKAWTLALVFVGNGKQFDGPGNVAADAEGNIWLNNNYTKSRDPAKICGGKQVFKLRPYDPGAPASAYSGGGLDGAGYGISIAPNGHVWVGNFGFAGSKCTSPSPGNSVSEFKPNGRPVSGPDGYTADISAPQATVADRLGNIWVANCASGQLTKYPSGDSSRSKVISTEVRKAFAVASDTKHRTWVTANGDNAVRAFEQDGTELPGSPFSGSGIDRPFGIASDSKGNVWVSNPGIPTPPCGSGAAPMPLPPDDNRGVVTKLDDSGQTLVGSRGGLTTPWGIVVDGNDNVWVANFSGKRIAAFCGVKPSTCAKGKRTGDPISPNQVGYSFDGLQRSTGLGLDGSGNVWVTNNWKQLAVPVNPGGNGVVAFIGMAAPVRTPNIGAPRQP